jgi:hypothetical protein
MARLLILYVMSQTSSSSFSATSTKSFQPVSKEEWQKIWLDKVSREFQRKNMPEAECQCHIGVIRRYLAEHPGNPRTIEIKKLKRFVAKQKADIRPSLMLFYTTIARSEVHMAALDTIRIAKAKPLPKNEVEISQSSPRKEALPRKKIRKQSPKAGSGTKKNENPKITRSTARTR